MTNEELRQALLAQPKNGYAELTEAQHAQMEAYISGYRGFLDNCKRQQDRKNGLHQLSSNIESWR